MRHTSTRGKKGLPHADPTDPPRRRANHRRGHGTFPNDRPPVAGVVGRQSGEVRLDVVGSASGAELEEVIADSCLAGTTVNTDEGTGYSRVGGYQGRVHVTVDHSGPKSTGALDLDGDGVREVHGNPQEGLWTGLRIFLSRFRGVSQWYLAQDVAVFQWAHNAKCATDDFLRALFGIGPSTRFAS